MELKDDKVLTIQCIHSYIYYILVIYLRVFFFNIVFPTYRYLCWSILSKYFTLFQVVLLFILTTGKLRTLIQISVLIYLMQESKFLYFSPSGFKSKLIH